MLTINGKRLCSNCFKDIKSEPCPYCGFDKQTYRPNPMALPCGTILFGKYIIGKTLGMGGCGITYLAYDVKADMNVAIKEFFPTEHVIRGSSTEIYAKSAACAEIFNRGAEKFYNEARTLSRFSSDNIVRVYEFFNENNTVYFSMEYLVGMSLKDYVETRGTINTTQAVNIAVKLSVALRNLHAADILHRDVSPNNIILCEDGTIKLIDFGAARQVGAEGQQKLSVILTPGFAPFEQYQSKGRQGPWTDIYSLGASIFYAMTGKIPDDPASRLVDDEDFAENKYNIYPLFFNVLKRCTMPSPGLRYQSVDELIADLGAIKVELQPIYPFGKPAAVISAAAPSLVSSYAANGSAPLLSRSVGEPLPPQPVNAPSLPSESAPVNKSNGLGTGAIIGIALGCTGGFFLLIGLIILLVLLL